MARDKRMLIVIIVLAVLLVAALGYIGYGLFENFRNQRDAAIYQEGVVAGYETAVTEIYSLLETCQPVPIRYLEETRQIIDVACLGGVN